MLKKRIAIVCRAWYPNHQLLFDSLQESIDDYAEILYIVTAGVESSKYNMRPWKLTDSHAKRILIKSKVLTIFDKDIIIPFGLIRILATYKPNLIICTPWSELASFISILFAKITNTRIYSWAPGPYDTPRSLTENIRNFFTRILLSLFIHFTDSTLVYGNSVTGALKKLIFYKNHLKNIHQFTNVFHSIDEEYYKISSKFERKSLRNQFRKMHSIPDKAFVIGYIGQLIERKGISILCSSLSRLLNKYDHVFAVILGTGPSISLANQLASQYPNRVLLLSNCESKNLKEIYSSIDTVVVPSLRDDWCTIINECFISRTPVIASINAYATRDLIKNEFNGFSFNPQNQTCLNRYLDRIVMGEFNLDEISDRAYDFLSKNWSLQHAVQQWYQIIKNS